MFILKAEVIQRHKSFKFKKFKLKKNIFTETLFEQNVNLCFILVNKLGLCYVH